jgi:HEAT repeat protein
MTSYSDFAPESSETLKLELQKQAVCEFLNDIENHFKFKKLLHSLQQVIRQNLYIPIQVTLERKYQHEVETFWGYGESEADIKHAWMLKRQYGIKGTELELQRPQVPWETEKKHHQRIMVLADPGMGKSALLRMEALSTARAERQKLLADEKSVDDVVFPLFIRLVDLDEKAESIIDAIPLIIQREYPKTWAGIEHLLQEKFRTGKCLLLLNALDEVPKKRRNHLSEKINQFAQTYPCPIICTSRIVGYGGAFLKGAKEVELVPFSQKQIEQYVEAWFKNAAGSIEDNSATASGLIQELQNKPQIRGLAQNSRLLYLLCSLYQEPEVTLPARRCQIYEKTVDYLLRKWTLHPTIQSEEKIQAKLRLLEELAYHFSCQGKELFSYQELVQQLDSYLRSDRVTSDFQNYTPEALLAELAREDGFFPQLSKDGDTYVFIHRITQDYLTASYLKRAIANNASQGMALVKQHVWDYDWHQPLSLLAGLLDNPIPLLETITREKDDIFSTLLLLAGRCIAECEEIAHPLITEIIDKIYQLWQSYPFAGFIESTVVALGQANSQMLYKLQQALKEKYYYKRKEFFAALVTALGQIGSPQAVETLIQILNQSPWYMRGEAAEALGRVGTPQAVNALIQALHDQESYVRGAAGEALGRIGTPQAIEALIQALHDPDSFVRGEAALALGQIGSSQALQGLIKVLNHKDTFVRWKATEACQIDTYQVVAALTRALNQPDRHIREEAAVLLGRIGTPQAVEALIPALQHWDRRIRERVAEALSRINSPQTLEALIPALYDSDSYVREEAAEALGRMGNPQVVEVLIPTLRDDNINLRKHAIAALGRIGGSEAAEALIPLLRQEDSTIRKHAVEALGQIGGASVVEALIPVLYDRDGAVRESAAVALSRIGTSETLETLLQRPKTDIYRPDIFPLIRMLAVRFSKENMPLIPVYPELIGPFGLLHRLWRRLVAHQPSVASGRSTEAQI